MTVQKRFDKSKLPSRHTTVGPERAPHRSYLYAMGLSDEEIAQPLVGVATCWNEAAPCNIALSRQAQAAKAGVKAAHGTPREFTTITVTDGIAMGHAGMKSSLVSREVIADSVELTMRGHCYDALLGLAGCDKSLPGMMMAMVRLNVPSVFMYGGSILPGRFRGRDVTVQDVFEAVGANAAGLMSDAELKALEDVVCPGAGACGGQYTANTMAMALEFIGLSAMGTAGVPAVDPRKDDIGYRCGQLVMDLLRRGLRPSDILTRQAFENAIAGVAASGGSTNGVLHLLAIAHSAGVHLELDDFKTIGARIPLLADVKPFGRYGMAHVIRIGGIRPMMKMLLDRGLLHGDCLTCTGETLAETLKDVKPYPAYPHEQDIIRPFDQPIKAETHPGKELQGQALRDAILNRATSVYHGVGTCRMGVDELAVVTPDLKVRGVEGLRVCDASIMPSITGGNTNAPAIMIGERGADIVLGRS